MNEFINMFYVRLFDTRPELCPLFGGRIELQARALAAMLEKIVQLLDTRDTLVPLLGELGTRHACARVRPEYYAPFGDALLWTLDMILGREFTPEVRRAWEKAYAFMAGNMR
jgi:nitric oxide dioxygenase